MTKLTQLPLGNDWIDLSTVTAVRLNKSLKVGDLERQAVVVVTCGEVVYQIDCSGGDEEARAVRDDIADQVNHADTGEET